MVGEKLGPFKIESILGSGAMGVVYKALHEPSNKTVAIKIIHTEVGQRGKAYDRFEREAKILKQFRHPNIVRYSVRGWYKETPFFVMEFIPGRTLDKILEERGPLPWKEVADLGKQICDALHYAHEHGVVHRDLKPSNLMVTDSGTVKLTDFGIAKDLDATALTATGRTLGTAAYMAPEQIRGTPAVSHKTDLYALGIVLYQMLCGRLPFEGNSAVVLMHAHINGEVPRPSSKVHEIPRALDDLVVQLMAKDPSDRPWDAAAVGEVLKTILGKASRGETIPMVWPTQGEAVDSAPPTRSVGDPARPRKRTRKTRSGSDRAEVGSDRTRRRLEILGMVLVLVAIGGFIGYMLWPPSQEYLYKQADRLMAASDRHDWYEARDSYLDPLDRRFPDHPYKEQTRAWRDKIALSDTESRARMLASPVQTQINKPHDKLEELFVEFNTRAAAAEKVKDEVSAAVIWDEMARQLRPDDREERPWHLLARLRTDELRKTITQRRAMVMKLLEQVKTAAQAGRVAEALTLRTEVVSKYGQYKDVADMLGLPPGGAPPASAPESGPGAAPPGPGGPGPGEGRPGPPPDAPGSGPAGGEPPGPPRL
jgi:eukaryotic-like serine/threonine-protein kinase